ncbi:MAG: DUF92 domain-containing protein [Bacilli bacterium]|nr:DUF92 domain-containing protein [Bacilli bacterium]
MIALGYLTIVVYLAAEVFGLGTLLKHFFGVEASRKAIHILTFGAFPLYHYFIGPGFHLIILCGALLLFAIVSYSFKLTKTMERENRGTPGTIYYGASLLSLAILVTLVPDLYPYFGLAFLVLALGDGLAGLVGFYAKGPKIYKEKTYIGSASCLVATFGGGLLYCWLYMGITPYLLLLAIALAVTIIELLDYGLDNLAIPFLTFGLSWVLFADNVPALIATFIFAGLFLLIHIPKLMTYYGALFSSFIGAMVYYCGSWPCLLFFMGMYLLYFVIHLIKKHRNVEEDGIVEKGHKKDGFQVMANGGMCLLAAWLFAFTAHQSFVFLMMVGCIALFTDTMASDLGAFSRSLPFDFYHRKRVENGVSGGVTLLGTLGSAIFAFGAGLLLALMLQKPLYFGAIAGGIAVIGCFIDTTLGSLVQVKFKCPVCGKTVEKKTHCDVATTHASGVLWMNNDMVNFLASVACFLFGLVFLVL